MSHGITEVAGESASGKTQLCLQLCLAVQLPQDSGGLDTGKSFMLIVFVFRFGKLLHCTFEHWVIC